MNGDATTNSFYPDLRRKLNNDAWPFIPKLFLMMMDVYQVLNGDRQGMIELQVRNISNYATGRPFHARSCRLLEDQMVLLSAELSVGLCEAAFALRLPRSEYTRTPQHSSNAICTVEVSPWLKNTQVGRFGSSKRVPQVCISFDFCLIT